MRSPDTDALQPFTKAIRQKLRSEIKRTEITAMALLRDADDMPEGLTVAHVNRWISGIIKTAPQSHFDYVLAKWSSLPDAEKAMKNGKPIVKRGARYADGAKRIVITKEMSVRLRAEMARTGIGFASVLDGLDVVPDGLNSRIIKGWLYGEVKSAAKANWDFVIARYMAFPSGLPIPWPIRRPRSNTL